MSVENVVAIREKSGAMATKGAHMRECPFDDAYRGRRVLLTGHTGFKGSWLSLWLHELGARVVGLSAYLPSKPCNFEVCHLNEAVVHHEGDVRNEARLMELFESTKPEIIFHLAAQPIVRRSYEDPKLTFETNLMGTVNVLECVRRTPSVKAVVLITSDKCYENNEWVWGYREDDCLGGKDPYSASKACAEIASRAYVCSFFSSECSPSIVTARAGNVIGGGDWAGDRIVPDCIRSLSSGKDIEVRNPNATRPWQHVLEPLSGYLWLGASLLGSKHNIKDMAFNFGPSHEVNRSVGELVDEITKKWGSGCWHHMEKTDSEGKECTYLKLNCDRAEEVLGWRAVLSFNETIGMMVDWYKSFYSGSNNIQAFSVEQILKYTNLAHERGLAWA